MTDNIKPILMVPDKLLRTPSKDIARVGDEERQLFDMMAATMMDANGIGLAAPQIGVLKKMVVIDFRYSTRYPEADKGDIEQQQETLFLANPEIITQSDELNSYQEGCLSLPNIFADITRPKRVKVRYWDYWDKEREVDADGLLATCLQHEIDHLYGKLIIDYMSPLRRSMVVKKLKKYKEDMKKN